MRNVTNAQRVRFLVDGVLDKLPEPDRETARDLSATLSKGLAQAMLDADDLDDITLAKFMVRNGYTLAALNGADLDLLIRQDLAAEAEARGA